MMESEVNDFVILGKQDICDYNEAGILPQSAETIESIQKWLDHTDYMLPGNEYMKHLRSYVTGTGEWIWKSDPYLRWYDSDCGLLWIKGVPGAGKSVWAASTADKISRAFAPVLFFFFRAIVGSNDNPRSLVKDWLSQILSSSPQLQEKYRAKVQSGMNIRDISTDQLWNDLCETLDLLPKVYCIVDALDEVNSGHGAFLPKLLELGNRKPQSIKVIITSRPIPRLDSIFRSSIVPQIRLEEKETNNDIILYIEKRLEKLQPQLDTETCETLKELVCKTARGLFLYARLLLDNIQENLDYGILDTTDLGKASLSLPDGLKALYTQLLAENSVRSGVPQNLQLFILKWVTHTVRPLRLLELAELLNFSMKSERSLKEDKELVRASCGRLLEVLPDETVSIIHHSFTEYLNDTDGYTQNTSCGEDQSFPVISNESAHRSMALTCLAYLRSGCLDDFQVKYKFLLRNRNRTQVSNEQDLKLNFPLMDYAISHWQDHAQKCQSDDQEFINALEKFINPRDAIFSAWFNMKWVKYIPKDAYSTLTPLHIAAYFGLTQFVQYLIRKGDNINQRDDSNSTPLLYASRTGQLDTFRLLLNNKADPTVTDNDGYTPLHYASISNHYKIIQLLLEGGSDPTVARIVKSRGSHGFAPMMGTTALELASKYGHVKVVRALLKYSTSIESSRALHWACDERQLNVVVSLLENEKIEVDYLFQNSTPLFIAAQRNSPKIIKTLIEKGANPNVHLPLRDTPIPKIRPEHPRIKKTVSGSTPIHGLVETSISDIEESLKLLIQEGGDINIEDDAGWTPLHYACNSSCGEEAVAYLLSAGANAAARSKDGYTPMHVLNRMDPRVIDILIHCGADVNARSASLETPLHTIVHTIVDGIASPMLEKLLENDADCNAINADGNTPLHLASSRRAVEVLLSAGANPNIRNRRGKTPLFMIQRAISCDSEFVALLQTAGADMSARDDTGNTVLFELMNSGNYRIELVKKLIDLGTSVNIKNNDGQNILHLFARSGRMEADMLTHFLDVGADPFSIDTAGNTVLHYAALSRANGYSEFQAECIKILISKGVSITALNYQSQAAVHFAAAINDDSTPYMPRWNSLATFLEVKDENNAVHDLGDDHGIRPIHYAAAVSQNNVFRLVKYGVNLKALTNEGLSPLHIAARARQSGNLGYLLSIYVSMGDSGFVNQKDSKGRTPLHYACKSGRPESVRVLVDAGADVNSLDNEKRSPLHMVAEFPIEDLIWQKSKDYDTKKWIDASGILLDDTNRPYHASSTNSCDLHRSTRCTESIRLLLEKGAEIEAQDIQGVTPLALAKQTKCEEMISECTSASQIHSLMTIGIYSAPFNKNRPEILPEERNNNLAVNEKLISKIIDLQDEPMFDEFLRRIDVLAPDQFDEQDRTVLHALTEGGYASALEKVAKYLQVNDLIPNWTINEVGKTDWAKSSLLFLACQRGIPNLEILRVLVERLKFPIDMLQKQKPMYDGDWYLDSAVLHYLARGRHWSDVEALKYLIKSGANLEVVDRLGSTPLHAAVESRGMDDQGLWKEETAKILLHHGANPNRTNNDGKACLHICSPEMARELLKHGADINCGKELPLISAITSGSIDMIPILIQAGADPNLRIMRTDQPHMYPHKYGEMLEGRLYPLYVAAELGCDKKVNTLLSHGARAFDRYEDGSTIIHSVIEYSGRIEAFFDLPEMNLERKGQKGRTLLLSACYSFSKCNDSKTKNDIQTIFHIINRGANIEAVDDNGWTPLHYLSTRTGTLCVEGQRLFAQIISKSRDLATQPDAEGQIPLHLCFSHLDQWRLIALITAGSDILLPDKDGNILLHYLASDLSKGYNNFSAQSFFSETASSTPSSINSRNNKGETPIFTFVNSFKLRRSARSLNQMLQFLLDCNPQLDLYARNNEGESLLHVIARNNRHSVRSGMARLFKRLVELGLDPLLEDSKQRTALDVAAASKSTDILELFPSNKKGSGSYMTN